jgi:hypothetical protein
MVPCHQVGHRVRVVRETVILVGDEGPILQLERVSSESFALTRRHTEVKQVWNFERFGIFISDAQVPTVFSKLTRYRQNCRKLSKEQHHMKLVK